MAEQDPQSTPTVRTAQEPSISILAPEVAARIAAGEVIERPASVVKELVENALDAGARRVEVLVEGGGLDLIRVADDGCGIPATELELAFQRHGTSKLRSDADLERLMTLGFRGEALPSIAAVAEVVCQTRHVQDNLGAELCLRGGQVIDRRPLARQPGTTVTVEDLFANVPARRKFLRARTTETGLAIQVVGHLALARPDIAFRLVTDGRQIFATAGDSDLRTAALAVRGAAFVRGAFDLGPLDINDANGQVLARVHGLLGPTQEQRAGRSGLSLFVNRRWVQNRTLNHAIEEGYRTFIRTGRYPVAIVFLDVLPEKVDVNVHPAKTEVRLLHERELYGGLRDAVSSALPLNQSTWEGDSLEEDHPDLGFSPDGLRVLGQIATTYIVAEGGLGLYLVDQHAAHERALLQDLREKSGRGVEQQQLLTPEVVELPPAAGLEPDEVCASLADLAFDAEPFGSSSVLVRALPGILAGRQALAGLEETLDALADQPNRPDWRERLSIELACKTAIKAGESLAPEEMQALVQRLGETHLHETCAHGRPTSLLLSHNQLAKQFGRT
jgi:DNA mismatch repair protein MutL